MSNPLLHNYLVEYVDGRGLTSLAAEVEAPDVDRAKTQMLNELEKRGLVTHKQRGKVRKSKSLGEQRMRAKMADKGTTGARLYIPWIQQGETETNIVLPKPNIPQPKIQPIQQQSSDGKEYESNEEVPVFTVRRQDVEARTPTVSEMFPEPEASPDEEVDLGTDYGGPLEQVFGYSPIMDVSRRSGGK